MEYSVFIPMIGVIVNLLQLRFQGNGNQVPTASNGGNTTTSPFDVIMVLATLWLLLYFYAALASTFTPNSMSSVGQTAFDPWMAPPLCLTTSTGASPTVLHVALTAVPNASQVVLIGSAQALTMASEMGRAGSTRPSPMGLTESAPVSPLVWQVGLTGSNLASPMAPQVLDLSNLTPASTPSTSTQASRIASCMGLTGLARASSMTPEVDLMTSTRASSTMSQTSTEASPTASVRAPSTAPELDVTSSSQASSTTSEVGLTTSSRASPVTWDACPTTTTWMSCLSRSFATICHSLSRLLVMISCYAVRLKVIFGSLAMATLGCLLFPTTVQLHALYTLYALILSGAVFRWLWLPRCRANMLPVFICGGDGRGEQQDNSRIDTVPLGE